jgi:molecular chaperone GrpE
MSNEPNAQAQQAPEGAETETAPELAAFEAELAKARDDLLRALAETENTRRRAERQVQDARAYAIDRFAGDLVPVADALSRALTTAPRDNADEGVRNMIAGLELTERALFEGFARHGLRRIGAKGDSFDPNLHQAVAQTPSDQPAGIVLEVLQPGYVLADRTLRAAMVLVSGGPAGGQPTGPSLDIKV